ncbi:MAG: hypothetical protein H7Y31_06050 [Chitinophagaceae bacterium]|nr:hypothetical protein [Chitinophagaceae bacterium]
MDYQQTGSKTNKMTQLQSKVPGMICRLGQTGNEQNFNPENMQTETLFTKVNLRPNPFHTSITLEVTSGQNKQVIVRMMDTEGQIIKLFGWYLLKGTNVTTVTELMMLQGGEYLVDILDNNGSILFTTALKKA